MSWPVLVIVLVLGLVLYHVTSWGKRARLALQFLSFRGKQGITAREMVVVSDGWIGRGSAYVILGYLEHLGLVRSEPEPVAPRIGIPVRRYWLTEKGWEAVFA